MKAFDCDSRKVRKNWQRISKRQIEILWERYFEKAFKSDKLVMAIAGEFFFIISRANISYTHTRAMQVCIVNAYIIAITILNVKQYNLQRQQRLFRPPNTALNPSRSFYRIRRAVM